MGLLRADLDRMSIFRKLSASDALSAPCLPRAVEAGAPEASAAEESEVDAYNRGPARNHTLLAIVLAAVVPFVVIMCCVALCLNSCYQCCFRCCCRCCCRGARRGDAEGAKGSASVAPSQQHAADDIEHGHGGGGLHDAPSASAAGHPGASTSDHPTPGPHQGVPLPAPHETGHTPVPPHQLPPYQQAHQNTHAPAPPHRVAPLLPPYQKAHPTRYNRPVAPHKTGHTPVAPHLPQQQQHVTGHTPVPPHHAPPALPLYQQAHPTRHNSPTRRTGTPVAPHLPPYQTGHAPVPPRHLPPLPPHATGHTPVPQYPLPVPHQAGPSLVPAHEQPRHEAGYMPAPPMPTYQQPHATGHTPALAPPNLPPYQQAHPATTGPTSAPPQLPPYQQVHPTVHTPVPAHLPPYQQAHPAGPSTPAPPHHASHTPAAQHHSSWPLWQQRPAAHSPVATRPNVDPHGSHPPASPAHHGAASPAALASLVRATTAVPVTGFEAVRHAPGTIAPSQAAAAGISTAHYGSTSAEGARHDPLPPVRNSGYHRHMPEKAAPGVA